MVQTHPEISAEHMHSAKSKMKHVFIKKNENDFIHFINMQGAFREQLQARLC